MAIILHHICIFDKLHAVSTNRWSNSRHETDVFTARVITLQPCAHLHHSKFELDAVNWDFEAIIRIKRLEIGCDEMEGGKEWAKGEGKGGRGENTFFFTAFSSLTDWFPISFERPLTFSCFFAIFFSSVSSVPHFLPFMSFTLSLAALLEHRSVSLVAFANALHTCSRPPAVPGRLCEY